MGIADFNVRARVGVWMLAAVSMGSGTARAQTAKDQAAEEGLTLPRYGTPETKASPLLPPSSLPVVPSLPDGVNYVPLGETVAVTRPSAQRQTFDWTESQTGSRRSWRRLYPGTGQQPFTWGLKGDVNAQVGLGLLTRFIYSDNVAFATNDRAVPDGILEISPVLHLDLGDAQSGMAGHAMQSEYYADLLYVPTLHELTDRGSREYPQHLSIEGGRVTDVSRTVLRLNYEEHVATSVDDNAPEDIYTSLDGSAMFEYQLTPKTTWRVKLAASQIMASGGSGDRDVFLLDAGLDVAATVKSKFGVSVEFGRIVPRHEGFGTQNYQQVEAGMEWAASTVLAATLRGGIEWREFDEVPSRDTKLSPVVSAAIHWQPSETTRINAGLHLANELSNVQAGALYQALRTGLEVTQDLWSQFYFTGEVSHVHRHYEDGRSVDEPSVRAVLGYRTEEDNATNRLRVELFCQWGERRTKGEPAIADRTQVGLQITRYF